MAETENTWRKRQPIKFPCKSGNEITVRRPGPDLALKAGKFARVLKSQMDAGASVEQQLEFIEKLPDDELEKLMAFARIFVADVVINPPLSLNPREGQLGPDDVPIEDFWQIYISGMRGFPETSVKLKEGETTVDAVTSFPEQSGSSTDASEDGGNVEGFPC